MVCAQPRDWPQGGGAVFSPKQWSQDAPALGPNWGLRLLSEYMARLTLRLGCFSLTPFSGPAFADACLPMLRGWFTSVQLPEANFSWVWEGHSKNL